MVGRSDPRACVTSVRAQLSILMVSLGLWRNLKEDEIYIFSENHGSIYWCNGFHSTKGTRKKMILSTRLTNKGEKKIPSFAGFLPGFSYILRHSKQLLSTCISAFCPERNWWSKGVFIFYLLLMVWFPDVFKRPLPPPFLPYPTQISSRHY